MQTQTLGCKRAFTYLTYIALHHDERNDDDTIRSFQSQILPPIWNIVSLN